MTYKSIDLFVKLTYMLNILDFLKKLIWRIKIQTIFIMLKSITITR